MSPTREVWKPLCANTRTAASRIRRRFSSTPVERSLKAVPSVVVISRRMQRPLAGMLVIDLTRYLPGAFASSELLRLGARVVRVEQPGGDPMRQTSGSWHDLLNAGKESVVCDLPRERVFARSLLERADVVLESFRPGVAARLGVG